MSSCVLDSSVALAFVLPDQNQEVGSPLLEDVVNAGAVVTGLWPPETGHVLLRAERRGRITADERTRAMEILRSLPLRVEDETASHAWTDALSLVETHGLTVDDSSYLELALRLELPLATRDVPLAAAARARGVQVLS